VLRAERRRRADLVAAALIVLVVALAAGLVVWTSQAAHTTLRTATGPAPVVPPEPATPPAALSEIWRAPSGATVRPVVAGTTVVTGDGTDVVGRNPLTGTQRWLYRRAVNLCTVGSGWGLAIAVYRRGAYCSEVTALHADTGVRGPQRNSDVPPGTQLLSDGNQVTATGANHLETWRSDLVKTLDYGLLRTQLEPDTQPRPDCRHTSVAVASGVVGVVERCPKEPTDRLTVLRPDDADSETPDEQFSVLLPGSGARLVALTADREAVLLSGPERLSIRDSNGAEVASYPLAAIHPVPGTPAHPAPGRLSPASRPAAFLRSSPPAAAHPAARPGPAGPSGQPGPSRPVPRSGPISPSAGQAGPAVPAPPAGGVEATSSVDGVVLWWTGSSTIALSADDLHPLWVLQGTLGPGTSWAGRAVMPAPGAEMVLNPATGAVERVIPVRRADERGPVMTAALGPVLLEQRGPTLVALR
jgi:hypothetical protein